MRRAWQLLSLRRNWHCTPNQKLACFVLYLKIINTILKNDLCILKQIVQLKNEIEILVGPVVFKLWIK